MPFALDQTSPEKRPYNEQIDDALTKLGDELDSHHEAFEGIIEPQNKIFAERLKDIYEARLTADPDEDNATVDSIDFFHLLSDTNLCAAFVVAPDTPLGLIIDNIITDAISLAQTSPQADRLARACYEIASYCKETGYPEIHPNWVSRLYETYIGQMAKIVKSDWLKSPEYAQDDAEADISTLAQMQEWAGKPQPQDDANTSGIYWALRNTHFELDDWPNNVDFQPASEAADQKTPEDQLSDAIDILFDQMASFTARNQYRFRGPQADEYAIELLKLYEEDKTIHANDSLFVGEVLLNDAPLLNDGLESPVGRAAAFIFEDSVKRAESPKNAWELSRSLYFILDAKCGDKKIPVAPEWPPIFMDHYLTLLERAVDADWFMIDDPVDTEFTASTRVDTAQDYLSEIDALANSPAAHQERKTALMAKLDGMMREVEQHEDVSPTREIVTGPKPATATPSND